MGKRINLTGVRFGKLIVKSYYGCGPQYNAAWLCLCDCGIEKVISSANLRHGHVTSCGCGKVERGERKVTHGFCRRGQRTTEYKMWAGARMRARQYNIPCNISVSDIIIPHYCPILGIELVSNTGGKHPTPNSPTLDRYEPVKGYVKGNVWVISSKANELKNGLTVSEWDDFIRRVENGFQQVNK